VESNRENHQQNVNAIGESSNPRARNSNLGALDTQQRSTTSELTEAKQACSHCAEDEEPNHSDTWSLGALLARRSFVRAADRNGDCNEVCPGTEVKTKIATQPASREQNRSNKNEIWQQLLRAATPTEAKKKMDNKN
jgi:hypothetical protein